MHTRGVRTNSSAGSGTELPLDSFYKWERQRSAETFLGQPSGEGRLQTWTFAQAGNEVRRIASYLANRGYPPGSRIGILSRNCAWWMLADLAIWSAGHVSVPVYASLKASSIRQILEHSGCVACFVGATDDSEASDQGIPEAVARIRFPSAADGPGAKWNDVVAGTEPLFVAPRRTGDDLATIIYTSGTTGNPKGAMHTFSALGFAGWTLSERFSLNARDRFFSYLPLAHILERAGLQQTALYTGASVFFTAGLATFIDDLKRTRPTVFLSVPRLLFKLQEGVFEKIPEERLGKLLGIPLVGRFIRRKVLDGLGLRSARLAACGGAPVPPELLTWYRRLGLDLAEGYGTTETMITHVPAPGTVRPGYVGQAVSGVETRIGPDSEVLIKSPMNMRGYYQDPAATLQAFTEDGFYRTGDMGDIASDGQLRIVGRIKEQFKTSKGKYIAPGPIESKLGVHPAIEACCLMGAGSPSPFAVIVLTPGARARCVSSAEQRKLEDSLAALLQHVNAGLEHHERVAFIVIADGPWSINNGLLTPTMKLKRPQLEAIYRAAADDWLRQGRTVIWESSPAQVTSTAA